jgi:hypothetical protein
MLKEENPPMSILERLPVTSLEVHGSPQEISTDVTGSLDICVFSCFGMPGLFL